MIACERPWLHATEVRRFEPREVIIIAPDIGLRSQKQLEAILHSRPNDEGDDEDDKVGDHQMGLVEPEKQKDNRPNPKVVSGVGRGLVRGRGHV